MERAPSRTWAPRRRAPGASSRLVERFEGQPETPAATTSFSLFPSTFTETQTQTHETHEYVVPLHVAWHDAAYPASPASSAYPYIVGEDEHGEEAQWSPASDAHSISMDVFPAQQENGGGRSFRLRSTIARLDLAWPRYLAALGCNDADGALTHTHARTLTLPPLAYASYYD
ncbi:hypothetical protein DFH09DRAFT_1339197 [Mycena vulgaris]|nr:hypothetical protein DFH09DRAFT_1339197 [Mycena vulgaris]